MAGSPRPGPGNLDWIKLIHVCLFRTREKEELIRRLSTNHATADIFKNTKNMRKFSTQSMRGDHPTLSVTIDSQRPSKLSNTSSNSSHHSNPKDGRGSVLTLLNSDGVQDPLRLRNFSISFERSYIAQGSPNGELRPVRRKSLKLYWKRTRRQSIKQVQKTSPKGAHELMAQANYRTEIQALKMAQKRESCTCVKNCFALCNIYIWYLWKINKNLPFNNQ